MKLKLAPPAFGTRGYEQHGAIRLGQLMSGVFAISTGSLHAKGAQKTPVEETCKPCLHACALDPFGCPCGYSRSSPARRRVTARPAAPVQHGRLLRAQAKVQCSEHALPLVRRALRCEAPPQPQCSEAL